MSNEGRWSALTTIRFADRADPMVDRLCCHIEQLLDELAREITLNRLIEQQLAELGIDLEVDAEPETDPEE